MKSIIIIIAAIISLSMSSCSFGTKSYRMQNVYNCYDQRTIRDWGNFKVGQEVEEGRNRYIVIAILK